MEYESSINPDTIIIVLCISLIVVLLVLIYIASVIIPFLKDRKYIIIEMERSSGAEYEYWKKQLKKLYKYYIPIIGRFLR